jgi:hypothetical protein
MDIQLDLSAHCIETELKKRYNKSICDYFKAELEERRPMEPAIEMIRLALEAFDFAKLRARYPALAGCTSQKIILSCIDKNLAITIDGKTINALE